MEVKSISKNFFRTKSAATEKIESTTSHSNPFGVSFKGNIINADVFTKSAPDLAEKVANKGKMWSSAIVGSISSINEKITKALSPVANFGRQIKENTLRLKENTLNVCRNIQDALEGPHLKLNLDYIDYSKGQLRKNTVSKIDSMWTALNTSALNATA